MATEISLLPDGPPSHRSALPKYVADLLRPEAFAPPAGDLRLFETHCSWVVLAGPYAYKIKKPVDFGFLDFSTREKRAAVCADEVRLNRRLCPDVYLGVVEVVRRQRRYHVGGLGQAVEPAVWMRRLPREGMLTALLERGAADAALMARIARRLASFHAEVATGPGVDEHGTLEAVQRNWAENFEQAAPFVGHTLPSGTDEAIRGYVEQFTAANMRLFGHRLGTLRIREGHGDLHAGSICVEGRRLQIFDCLEFSARFRCADVAAEVAFLAMDLDHFGRPDLADAFVDEYVRASGDRDLPRLLDFYRCYRAYVRGKVLSLRLTEPGLTPASEARTAAEARAYFEQATRYATGQSRDGPP
jgi:aminoglycoside phosphotransferase family enzyme